MNGETVSFLHPEKPGQALSGYLVKPTKLPAPGMLVLHEAYGLNQNIQEIAQRFADNGYVALAADLYSDGNQTVCMARAMYGLIFAPLINGTARKVRAAFEFLQKMDGVDSKRVGAIGFCMGGSYALQLACLDGSVAAISVVSGQNPRPQDAMKRLCPVVGSYADPDFVTGDARKLDVVLDEYKIPHDIKIYQGAKHSLFNSHKAGYSVKVAEDAWARTLGFFAQHIWHAQ